MILRTTALAGLATAIFALPSVAAIYNITSIEDGSVPGFGFSMFHTQSGGQMSGGTLEDPDPLALDSGSYWNTTTGEISLSFGLVGGGNVSGAGTLSLVPSADFGSNLAVGGDISFKFSGATNVADGDYGFVFADGLQSGPANGVDNAFGFLSLWGDQGNYQSGCSAPTCFGVDLRLGLELSDDNEPEPVPLPASMLFLMGGLGGLGALRKMRKKTS
ncbi:putative secreted protein [Litoreibacter ponti]|uniref:Putative secreted protein n=1 Tax=Litoreibacter ponti TaxID=1510457 RepID=A0A2T6BFR2_9RHOB|nr:VPLPA-CTERM sorting domain-containing protein [Litoreibacter ponti]PTX54900.1 putative secreted protein [Litoreibacter ponti]